MSNDQKNAQNSSNKQSRTRFAITEIIVAVVIIAILVALILPVYLNYDTAVDDSWEVLTLRTLTTLEAVQKDLHLRTGTYGTGEFNRVEEVFTLEESTGWAPSIETNTAYHVEIVKNGVAYRVIAVSKNGTTLCRIYPGAKPCNG